MGLESLPEGHRLWHMFHPLVLKHFIGTNEQDKETVNSNSQSLLKCASNHAPRFVILNKNTPGV